MTEKVFRNATCRVGLVQMDCVQGDLTKNVARTIEIIKQNKGKADFLVFPELSLTGYDVGSKFHEYSLRIDDELFEEIVQSTKELTVAIGFVEETESFSFYNSMAIIKNKKIIHIHRKIYLPNYGIFEERKYFSPGHNYKTFDMGKFCVAPFICGDAWNPAFVHLGAADLASVLVISVCSPQKGLGSKLSSEESWKRLTRFYATMYGCYVVFVNRVGKENNLIFWGKSEMIDPFGNEVISFSDDSEGVLVGDMNSNEIRESRTILTTVRDEDFNFIQRRLERVMNLRFYGNERSW